MVEGSQIVNGDTTDDPVGGDATEVDAQQATPAEDAVALEIRRLRLAAGLTQNALAKRAGFQRQYISRAENPARGLPSSNLVAVLDVVLGAGGKLVELHTIAGGGRQRRRRALVVTADAVEVHLSDDGRTTLAAETTVRHDGLARAGSSGSPGAGLSPARGSVEVPVSERVHELFVRAQNLLSSNDRFRVESAGSLLDQALVIEPQFARARAARAYAAWRCYFSGWDRSSAALDSALLDVQTALSRDPYSIGARTTLIRICWDMGWHEQCQGEVAVRG
jgi:DNA-binding XRE family transcriptional regulator